MATRQGRCTHCVNQSLATTSKKVRGPQCMPHKFHAYRQKPLKKSHSCKAQQSATSTSTSPQQPALTTPSGIPPYTALQDKTVYLVSTQQPVQMGSLWSSNQAAVVFWARSMGCPFCWELSINLHRNIIPQLGPTIPLYLVTIGTPERGLDFVKKTGFPADRLLADPTSVTYAAIGLKKGVVDTFLNPATPLALAKRAMQGDLKTLTEQVLPQWEPWQPPQQDQALQQGGVVVFAGDDATWVHWDPATSVHADLDQVVQEARAAAALVAGNVGVEQ